MDQSKLPMLYHVHGVGPFDFSSMTPDDLESIDAIARERQVTIVPTIFLRSEYLEIFVAVCRRWQELRNAGEVTHIAGFGVEGPLLGSSGGVPDAGCWTPNAETWRVLAGLGRTGLRYLVVAPDALTLGEEIEQGFQFRDLVDLLQQNGVRLALGHFRPDDPTRSAAMTAALIDYVASNGVDRYRLIAEHLYNDMPRAFVHAWRTPEAKSERPAQLAAVLERPWRPDTLAEVLGAVPATLIQAALDDRLTLMLNFDGHHVDLEICRATVDYLGAERIIAITDHIEVLDMAGEHLHPMENGLLLRSDNIVAAGSTGLEAQIANMRDIGLSERYIDQLVRINPQLAVRPLLATESV